MIRTLRLAAGLGVLVASLGVATPVLAEAQGPLPGGGRIDVGGGWRYLPGESGGGVVARFGWQADRHFLLGIEVGGSLFYQQPTAGPVRVLVGKLLITSTYQILTEGPVLPYVSLGIGYGLVGTVSGGAYAESGASDFFGGLGVYLPLTRRVGIVIEDRFELANASVLVHGTPQVVRAGGNLLWAGVVFTFAPEADRTLAP